MKVLSLALIFLATLCPAQQTSPDWNAAKSETVQFLSDLIRIDTSDPPGQETKADNYLKSVLDREGIASEIIESVPGRGNLIARLKGDGSGKPLLIMAHTDVVPVDRTQWSFDPFGGTIKDGYIYGRGAIDDKGFLAANLEVFLLLHRLKIPLKRDVIFLAEAGEEADATKGMKFLVDNHWDKIACEYSLNEGGGTNLLNGKVDFMSVSTTEKVPRRLDLKATGTSGHGSIPRLDNPITHLAAAVEKTGTWETPARLNETTREFFRRLATISPPDEAALYRNIEDPATQQKLRSLKPQYYSMLRTSVVPTMIKGGFKDNVIPPSAEAVLDVRALPDEDMQAFMAQVVKLINDPALKVEPVDWETSMPTAPPSSLQTEMFHALEVAQKKIYPGAITLPTMTTGASDSAFLRTHGVQSYGVHMPLEQSDRMRAHGNDERAPVASEGSFVEFVYTVVTMVAGK